MKRGREKPFSSKQTRGETGKKQKPNRPKLPTVVKGNEQFYFHGLVFQTKKELKDRIKELLISLAGAPAGKDAEPSVLSSFVEAGPTIISRSSRPLIYAILVELVSRHPNFAAWGNKNLEQFQVTRAATKKAPPILWATFRGSSEKWRDMKWRKCIHKTRPTHDDELWSAMWHAIRPQIAPCRQLEFFGPPGSAAPKITLACEQCGRNKLWIDNVAPSYTDPTRHFLALAQHFLAAARLLDISTTTERRINEPNHLEWSSADNSFRFRPCDAPFREAWVHFHTERAELRLLCEACRVQCWVASLEK